MSGPMTDAAQSDHPIVRKPSWLDRATFDSLLDRYDGVPRCEVTGETEDLTVDHIVSRYHGGTDDLSNLQFLARRQNSVKGIREDAYWRQSFFWDRLPGTLGFAHLRRPQQELFDEIAHFRSDWFGRTISEIARHLYVNAWVVGSGKTFGIPVAAWAVNQVIREYWGPAARRVDRILVVAKEQAIRDQIAESLAEDLVAFGIANYSPRVGVVTDGAQFKQQAWLDSQDIIVTCEQQLWESNGQARTDLAKILAYFPMIAFDEPHYAPDQIAKIVDTATTSLCFGFTGTPVDRCGVLLPRMVELTVYDYQEASATDRSLKYLDAVDEHFSSMFVREMGIHDAQIIERGEVTRTEDTRKAGYNKNIEPAKAVIRGVIEEIRARDELVLVNESPALHRRQADVDVSLTYPVHAQIFLGDIATAEALEKNHNEMFTANRQDYPLDRGWRVEVVHAGSGKLKPKPLARSRRQPPHPWMRARKEAGYRVDRDCARILLVVGMGREGIDNPLCGVVGVACVSDSVIDAVQGWLGRQLRAVIQRVEDTGRVEVPPAPLDTVRVVTHRAFDVSGTIQRGIKFVCDMRGSLIGLPTIDELEGSEPRLLAHIERDLALPPRDKIAIAGYIGEQEAEGSQVDINDVIRMFSPDGGRRAERVGDWATKVRDTPDKAREEIRLGVRLEPVTIVLRERLKHEPTDRELERYVKIHQPDLTDALPVSSENRRYFLAMHGLYAERFQQPPLTSGDTINDLSRRLVAGQVISNLGRHFTGDQGLAYRLSVVGVKKKLGVPREEVLCNDGNWDTPQVHAIIRRPEIQAEIVGWVTGRLIDEGYCPALNALRRPMEMY